MSEIIKPADAAKYLKVAVKTLADWRYEDRGNLQAGNNISGPAWVDSPGGRRCLGYTQEALDAWVARQQVAA